MFHQNKTKQSLRRSASVLPWFCAGVLAFITVGGLIRLYGMADEAFASALQIERQELSTELAFTSDDENTTVDSTTPYYTEIRTKDNVLLWRSDRPDNPQTDAWFGLIGDVASYQANQASEKTDRYFISNYYNQLFRQPSYSLWTGLDMPDRTYTLTLYNSLQNEVTAWMNQHQIQGSIFAYNASTGDIYCMASTPHRYINNNMYSYTPGSTMKLLTLFLAAEQGIDLENLSYICSHEYTLKADGKVVRCTGTHGAIGTAEAIGCSCNCFFAQLIEQLDFAQAAQTLENLGVLINQTGYTFLGQIRRAQSYVIFSDGMTPTFNGVFQLIGQDSGLMSPIDMAYFAALFATRGEAYAPRLLTQDQPEQLAFAVQHADTFARVYALWQEGYQTAYKGYSDLITTAKTGTVSGLGPDNRRQRTLCLWSEPLQTAAFIVLENYDDCGVSLQEAANYLVEQIERIEARSN